MEHPIIEMASGDIKTLTFAVHDEDTGAAINISAYTEVSVKLFAMSGGLPTGAALLTENLAGDVDLVNDATDEKYTLALAAADTASLAGDYWIEAKLTDAAGNFRHTSPVILRILADIITS